MKYYFQEAFLADGTSTGWIFRVGENDVWLHYLNQKDRRSLCEDWIHLNQYNPKDIPPIPEITAIEAALMLMETT